MLQPSHLAQGKGIGNAVNSVLQQYSGLQTDADDMLVSPSCTCTLQYSKVISY